MKLFGLTFRDKTTQTVEAYETWVVRWVSYENNDRLSFADKKEQMRVFPHKQAATEFYQALKDSETLTRSNFDVKLYKDNN